MAYCGSCGAELEVGVKYCSSCGTSVKINTEVDSPNNLASYKNNEMNDLGKIVTNFANSYSAEKSENLYFGDGIQEKFIEKHKKLYLNLDSDEKVLVLLNKAAMFGNVFSGLVITNKKIHYRLVKKSFFASILPWLLAKPEGNRTIVGLDSIEIAEHDACLGTAYVGHELRINNEILGYLRMGTGMLADEKALVFLNALFDNLAENGIIKRKVNTYTWQ